MSAVFLRILNMSLTAGWMILAVVVLRFLFKKAPKWVICLLWGLVAVRLLCPVSFESSASLIPSGEPVAVSDDTGRIQIRSGIGRLDRAVEGILPAAPSAVTPAAPGATVPTDPLTVAAWVWLAGAAVMLGWGAVSWWRLRRRIRVSVRMEENVYLCDGIGTPFILGVLRPRVYLPSTLTEEQIRCVLAHERAHLKRRDHWVKPLGYLLLAVYWFHPLLWVAYALLCRDVEFACDEKVAAELSGAERQAYSAVLLACSAPRRLIAACPLAFGEVGVKARIKSVLHYKKPTFWILLAAVAAGIVAAALLLTDPKPKTPVFPFGERAYRVSEVIYDVGLFNFSETPENAPRYRIADEKLWWDVPPVGTPRTEDWWEIGPLTVFEPNKEDLEPYFNRAQGTWFGGASAEEIYNCVLWGGMAEQNGDGFLLLMLKDGPADYLLCRIFGRGEQAFVRWVEKLEPDPTPPAPTFSADSILPVNGFTLWVDRRAPGVDYGASFRLTLPEDPGVTFICTPDEVTADGERLIAGMPVLSVYLADLTGDGKRELCASWDLGSGIVNEGVTVYDYAAGTAYTLSDRMRSDFVFEAADGALIIKKTPYMYWTLPPEEQQAEYGIPAIVDGVLVMIT